MRLIVLCVAFAVTGMTAYFWLKPASAPSPVDPVRGPRETPLIYTTFHPTTYWVERIGSDRVEVRCPVPEDEDPIFWSPPSTVVRDYQGANLIVINGASFEKWVEKVTLPPSRVVDSARPFADEWLRYESATTHSHGPQGEHSHEGIDGHTWLDPQLAKAQAREIMLALVRLLPEHEVPLRENYEALIVDLDALDRTYRSLALGPDGPWVLASHPAYNYLVARYDWRVVNLDLDPESMPTEAEFAAIATRLEKSPSKLMLWESAPLPEIADRMNQRLGLQSVVFSPCELLGPEERAKGANYLTVMQDNLRRLEEALETN